MHIMDTFVLVCNIKSYLNTVQFVAFSLKKLGEVENI